jgi:alkanesulfonate monooxygenase SsuD/methylene tetrahydromethanopterin reductase-like flavin-dependent oxidoreductase (luciferase family)
MKLGLFLMPLHNPKGDLPSLLREDRECIVYIDDLGYEEAWVGEHYCSITEPIPDPMQFMASLIHVTKQIKFGTAVLNLPQHHPVQVAGNAALFDHLSNGRFLMGVGPGGLQSDMEMFGTKDIDRHKALIESVKIIHMLWSQDPPYHFDGEFWKIHLEKTVDLEMGIGPIIRPLQKPFPPLAVSAMSPRSATAELAGSQDWGLISANFTPHLTAKSHWESYCKGAEETGQKPDRAKWRLARSIVVTETQSEAEDYLANPDSSLRWYYHYLHHSFSAKNILQVFKGSRDIPDAEVSVDNLLRDLVLCGPPMQIVDRLIAIIDDLGPLGGLLVSKIDWDNPDFQKRSYELLAQKVMPKVRAYVEHSINHTIT